MAVSPYGRDVAQRHRRRVMLAIAAIAAVLLAATTFIPFPSTDPSPGANDAVLTSEGGLCAGKSLLLERRFSLKEGIVTRTGTGNDHSWTPAFVYLEVGGRFEGRCNAWGDHLGLRHLAVLLRVHDEASPFRADDTWLNGNIDTFAIRGQVADYSRDAPNLVESDGGKLLASFEMEWTPSRANSVNISFMGIVLDLLAERHVGDPLRVTAVLVMTVGETLCAGACWSPFASKATSEVLVLETVVRGEPI